MKSALRWPEKIFKIRGATKFMNIKKKKHAIIGGLAGGIAGGLAGSFGLGILNAVILGIVSFGIMEALVYFI